MTLPLSTLQTGAVNVDSYKDSDLSIGAQLNVWGRKIVLCDCDDFTKEFYRTKYGVSKYLCYFSLTLESLIIR